MRILVLLLMLVCSAAVWSEEVFLVKQDRVRVAADGGAAEVRFALAKGRRVTIRLTSDGLQPYGFLEWPGGSGYYPPNEGASNGVNVWQGVSPITGIYVLTVFDGSGRGGEIEVRVEEERPKP